MFRAVKRPILMVDDHEDSREMVSALLVELGLSVLQAPNGREALDLLIAAREAEPFLILLDLEMPIMTGWEFLEVVRAGATTIPVVITSGSHRVSEIMLRPPILAFLPKPMTFNRLLDMVRMTAPLPTTDLAG